jgi:hypothetical protein
MEPMSAFLLAMQAAGLVSSIFGAKSQQEYIRLGRKLEQEQFATNLQAIRLQSADSSLEEMKQLRKNIGSQIAIQAARGNRGGSSYAGISTSSRNFDNDESRRRINLLAKESELRAHNVLSGLHTLQSESQLGRSLTSSILNSLPISSLMDAGAMQGSAGQKQWIKPEQFSWGF